MTVLDLFSKRQKRLRGEMPDVFTYDPIPPAFRIQILHIWDDGFGTPRGDYIDKRPTVMNEIRSSICREYGQLILTSDKVSPEEDLKRFLLSADDSEKVLDVIELSFRTMDFFQDDRDYKTYMQVGLTCEDAIKELNERFREHGLGYQFENYEIIKVDTVYLHQEAVKPALLLLNDSEFEGPDDEFRKAHEHYRHGRIKEALNEASRRLRAR
jgi:hypothetical protein